MLVQKLLNITLSGAEWVLYLLLILSVFSVAIMIEKFIIFRIRTIKKERFDAIIKRIKEGGIEAVKEEITGKKTFFEKVFLYAVSNGSDSAGMEEALNIAIMREKLSLEKRLAFLGTLGNNAPFIGLFGTVLGIIKAFHDLSVNQQGGAAVVMAGISEALVATAVGLFVAIPAVVAYNYFMRWIKRIVTESETAAREAFLISGQRKSGEKDGR
ncbi:MAG: MotA/TolQ/ExbB proton channel family protein [Deltaproteobacteria bacterium]|nr:MotA/TolQ/ExbB proton channel family protein [Deltaproteobacteria bacterium]